MTNAVLDYRIVPLVSGGNALVSTSEVGEVWQVALELGVSHVVIVPEGRVWLDEYAAADLSECDHGFIRVTCSACGKGDQR